MQVDYPLAISTSWNSHHHVDGKLMLVELAELGYQWVELSHGLPYSLLPGIVDGVQEGIVKISSVHNFFPLPIGVFQDNPNCYEFSDLNEVRRRKAVSLSMETLNHAAQLGAQAVVFHIGSTGQRSHERDLLQLLRAGKFGSRQYVQLKLKVVSQHRKTFQTLWPLVRDSLLEVAEHAAKLGLTMGLECRESAREIPLESEWETIFNDMPEHVGYWHDFGHSMRKEALGYTNALQQFQTHASRLVGCHIHDFAYPNRDHQVPGDGVIPFADYWPSLPQGLPLPFVLELSPHAEREKVAQCLNWWKENGPASPGA